jgi:hypothetical protein
MSAGRVAEASEGGGGGRAECALAVGGTAGSDKTVRHQGKLVTGVERRCVSALRKA